MVPPSFYEDSDDASLQKKHPPPLISSSPPLVVWRSSCVRFGVGFLQTLVFLFPLQHPPRGKRSSGFLLFYPKPQAATALALFRNFLPLGLISQGFPLPQEYINGPPRRFFFRQQEVTDRCRGTDLSLFFPLRLPSLDQRAVPLSSFLLPPNGSAVSTTTFFEGSFQGFYWYVAPSVSLYASKPLPITSPFFLPSPL